MGILSRLAARRIERLDRVRLELFTLEETKLAVEAQPVKVTSGWPAPMGMPIRPSQTSDWKSIMVDWLSYFPFMAVLLLTDSHLRWVPYRSYRGRLVYQDSVDSHLAEGDPKEKGIYGKFPHATLGERAVALRKVKRVSLDIYDPSHLAVINVHLTEPTAVKGEGNWPAYQLEGLENVVPVPAEHFSEDSMAGPVPAVLRRRRNGVDVPSPTGKRSRLSRDTPPDRIARRGGTGSLGREVLSAST
jgi:hypothetical protein